jgi:hypothetical protein
MVMSPRTIGICMVEQQTASTAETRSRATMVYSEETPEFSQTIEIK